MLVTLDVSHLEQLPGHSRGWLKTAAFSNMCAMSVTLDVSNLRGWLGAAAPLLKSLAPANMYAIFSTFDVSQSSFWLKASALKKKKRMSVAADVSQDPMSKLKVGRFSQIDRMSDTWDTSQALITP